MKKLTALLLMLTMLLSFAACGSTGTEPAADKAVELPELVLEPRTVYDSSVATLDVVGCGYDSEGFHLDIKITNKTTENQYIICSNFEVNGMWDDTIEMFRVPLDANAELEHSLYFRSEEQLANGVDAVTKIKFNFSDGSDVKSIVLFPHGTQSYTRYLRPAKEGDVGIIDCPEGSAVYTGHFWDDFGFLNLNMYLQNNNELYVRYFQAENVCVNGIPIEHMDNDYGLPVNSGMGGYDSVRITPEDLLAAGIVKIDEVSFDLVFGTREEEFSRGHLTVGIEDSTFGGEYFDDKGHLTAEGAALFMDNNSAMKTLMDNEYCQVVLVWMYREEDGTISPVISMENKTDEPLNILFMVESYNGLDHMKPFMVRLDAGGQVSGKMPFKNDGPEKDYIEVITHIAGSISVIGTNGAVIENERFDIYPYGEAFAYNYTRELQPEDRIVLDNEQFLVAVTGYEKLEGDAGYIVELYLERKDTDYLSAKVVSAQADEMSYDMSETQVGGELFNSPAGYFSVHLPLGYGLTELGNIEIVFNVEWMEAAEDGSPEIVSEQVSVKVLP